MQYFELATLTLPVGQSRGAALAAIMDDLTAWIRLPGTGGALLGVWVVEFGPQNRLAILRAFDTRSELEDERRRVLGQADPFGLGDRIMGMQLESFAQFPGLPPVAPGSFGPVYEFRTYILKTGGIEPTIAAWAPAIPPRTALSPLVVVMHALDGPPRFIHVWAYRDHDERMTIRAEAFASKVWPPPGAPQWLTTDMKSELYLPVAGSPLQ